FVLLDICALMSPTLFPYTTLFRSGSRHCVDVDSVREGLPQLRDVGDMGQHAQLDLAVVGRDQKIARIGDECGADPAPLRRAYREDRKSTRLNSSHVKISYAVFCLK